MILQVNKKRLKDKEAPENFSDDVFLDFYYELQAYSTKQKIIPSSEYPRKSGKTTTLKNLAERYEVPYISNLSNAKEIRESIRLAEQNNRMVIVDEVDTLSILELNKLGIEAVGIVQNNNKNIQVSPSKKGKTHEVFEDYINISSIRKMEGYIAAQTGKTLIYLSSEKEFDFEGDEYNQDNSRQDFYIDSVYLLDDTGKTIKKLM